MPAQAELPEGPGIHRGNRGNPPRAQQHSGSHCKPAKEDLALFHAIWNENDDLAGKLVAAAARGKAVSRERFLDSTWGYIAFPTTRTVDNHIAKLGAKLEPDPTNPKFLITVQRVGYRLELPS